MSSSEPATKSPKFRLMRTTMHTKWLLGSSTPRPRRYLHYKPWRLLPKKYKNCQTSGANAWNRKQISIGISTTQLLHNVATALKFQAGDELVLSKLNHEANTSPWVHIADRLGLTVKWWAASDPKNPACDPAELKPLLSDKTRLVACPHASNITGTISPIRKIADVVHVYPRVGDYEIYWFICICSHGHIYRHCCVWMEWPWLRTVRST
jgi:hypothetical protein